MLMSSTSSSTAQRPVAVVGAGLAGARCAALLREAGCAVVLVDKSRGPGGRLATRRAAWTDREGQTHAVAWDHGAPGLEADAPDLLAWLNRQAQAGRARCWQPRVAGAGLGTPRWQGLPTQPALCQALLGDAPVRWQHTVQALRRAPEGWTLDTEHGPLGPFAAVVLALPPAQAAPLLAPHRDDWARAASLVPMQPCWTLMGVSDAPDFGSNAAAPPDWWLPQGGPLERLTHQATAPGAAAWVAHASPSWSRQHLEAPADGVRDALQAAVVALLGQPLHWHLAMVHRWRYARPVLAPRTGPGTSRWDAGLGLGLCGDHLAGLGAEAAWRSGTALAQRMLAAGPLFHALPPVGRADGAVLSASAPC